MLYKLRQVELGTRKDAEMKKWLPLYDLFRNLMRNIEFDLETLKNVFKSLENSFVCQ